MNKRLLGLAVAGSMVLGLAVSATAGVPDVEVSTATGPASTTTVLITPAGLGDDLGAAGATVTVTVLDTNGDAIAGYPFQDVVLDDSGDSSLNICPGGSTADGNTDAFGVTTISNPVAGGGSTQNGLRVYLAGDAITGVLNPALDIQVNSPDIAADRVVNLTDIGAFATDFSGAYAFRSDFVFDGVINLSDIGRFATSVGEVCP